MFFKTLQVCTKMATATMLQTNKLELTDVCYTIKKTLPLAEDILNSSSQRIRKESKRQKQ